MSAPKLSNLDCTRRAVVKKGCVVEFLGGARAHVQRVRLGELWTTTHPNCRVAFHRCADVRVVSS